MKRNILFFAAAVIAASCGQNTQKAGEAGEVKSASAEAAALSIDKAGSTVKWEGGKLGGDKHMGTISISEGSLSVKEGRIESGNFTLDMTTMADTDLTDTAMNAKLIGHLKSGDFFQVDSFPTARFEITGVKPGAAADSAEVSGNLTIKGVTKGITFPAKVAVTDSTADAAAHFTINRNDWGVIWGGSKTDKKIMDMLKNDLIKDEITFDISLKAKK